MQTHYTANEPTKAKKKEEEKNVEPTNRNGTEHKIGEIPFSEI